uniref:Uncharacterized protein n=1 Tax=Arundo donax TaxID=35708 RepID=A0A0A8YIG9_ARUDO
MLGYFFTSDVSGYVLQSNI